MSENHYESEDLSRQPGEEDRAASAGADSAAEKEKIILPVTPDAGGNALSDERATADHDDLLRTKSDALLAHSNSGTDAAAEDAVPHQLPEPETAPELPAVIVPAESPLEVITDAQSPVPVEPAAVAPREAEICVEPTPQFQQQAAQRKRKTRKVLLAVIPILILAVVLAILTPAVILPELHRMQAYNAAENLLGAGMYDEASEAFAALGEYKDSPIMALEARYRKAEYLAFQEDYATAITIWQELGSYSDSAVRAEQAEFDWKDVDYQAALALVEQGQFLDASRAFAALGDYRDSISLVEDCQLLQLNSDYCAADAALAEGNYEAAIDQFKALDDYADAYERYLSASYEYGCLLLEEGKYEKAIRRLGDASGYEDANDKIIQAHYLYGSELLNAKKYEAAITQLQKAGDYKDAAKLILKAKYGYVQANMVRTNSTTQTYLKTLIAENYPGAQKLYGELYAWKVEIIAYNNSPYSTTSQSTISKYGPMCIHFRVTGGEPGATIDLVGNLTAPNGQSGNVYFNSCSDGDTLYATFEYYQPAYGATGTLSLRIYDSDGRLMTSGSVRVTN